MSRGSGEGEFLKPFTFRLGPTPWTWTVDSTSLGSGTLRLHLPHSGRPSYSLCSLFSIFFFNFFSIFLLYLISGFYVVCNVCTSGFISVCASEQLMTALEPKRSVLSILLCQCSIKWPLKWSKVFSVVCESWWQYIANCTNKRDCLTNGSIYIPLE